MVKKRKLRTVKVGDLFIHDKHKTLVEVTGIEELRIRYKNYFVKDGSVTETSLERPSFMLICGKNYTGFKGTIKTYTLLYGKSTPVNKNPCSTVIS
jgi:hypothetical protein